MPQSHSIESLFSIECTLYNFSGTGYNFYKQNLLFPSSEMLNILLLLLLLPFVELVVYLCHTRTAVMLYVHFYTVYMLYLLYSG